MPDLSYALRTLAKTPGFTFVAVLTLAVAIGVNSVIFSLVNSVILRPTAPPDLVALFTARADATQDYRQFSHREYAALREAPEVFSDIAALNYSLAGLGPKQAMRRSFVFLVSENYFDLLDARPALGRFFTAAEARPNARIDVVVISHSFWQRLGGKRDVLGSMLHVNGRPHTIVGVAPRGFSGGHAMLAPEAWLPLGTFGQLAAPFADSEQITDLAAPANYTLNLVARLAPGISADVATTRLSGLARRLDDLRLTASDPSRQLQLTPVSRFSISTSPSEDGPLDRISVILIAMAAVVLLIASINLANMLLARSTSRAREIAIRLALGASRWRLVRQLLVEGLLLALFGGALGLLLCLWANDLLLGPLVLMFESMSFSLTLDFNPDARVLAATCVFALLATLVFSLGPALRATRPSVIDDLKQQGGDPALHGRWNRFFAVRHCLVMAQIALSLTLLFSAGLFFRAALAAGAVDLGFPARGALVAEIDYSLTLQDETTSRQRLLALADHVAALPGVEHAGLTTLMPFGNITNTRRVIQAEAPPIAPETTDDGSPGYNAFFASISPGFFDALGVRLLHGRGFTAAEVRDKDAPRVGIIDERLARELFPDENPIGRRVRYTQPPTDGSPPDFEVVGVVSAHRHDVIANRPPRRLYVPLAQGYNPSAYLQVRFATHDSAQLAAQLTPLRQAIQRHDPEAPLLRVLPLEDFVERDVTLWVVRLGAALFGVFGVVALLLAIVGVYGVKAYAVARRTREIGIRMALGARPRDVFQQVMRQGALQTAFALALGLGLALLVGQLVSKLLYQVSPHDPLVLAIAAGLLALTTLFACFIPARRATRVNPIEALRSE